ncbi:hypothetical protein AMATHDRAFT_6400 [Amanita thiersii Skay4041]|uniref:Uncharacterized protein n=1 Tax=Amanita thiersii Skay4041 TaxID=703135 RepID=A0A2A9NEQ1_9AGAR|nr:hypothetical protein AMATHDRAFT_6400 [Amanita thiersii Skay4041]
MSHEWDGGKMAVPMILRSSAPNTSNQNSRQENQIPTPTRKAPQCRTCKRPRAGHPRSGCPYANNDPAPTREATAEAGGVLLNALGSFRISSPSRDNEGANENANNRPRAAARRLGPTETRLSLLSTTSGEILERLRRTEENQRPLNDTQRRLRARIVDWQHSVAAAISESTSSSTNSNNRGDGRPVTPSIVLIGSTSGVGNVGQQGETPVTIKATSRQRNSRNLSPSPSPTPRSRQNSGSRASGSRPLGRSMSIAEREEFIRGLVHASDATLYVLPKTDIFDVQASAVQMGFHARAVMNDDDESDLQGLLIIAREEDAAEWLLRRIEREDREVTDAQSEQVSVRTLQLTAAAGGAVIGAVGAWAGLAFS